MQKEGDSILILGASARAAARSAIRAGLRPWACDLFADADLRLMCPTRRVERYPHGLIEAAAAIPEMPWMYTGGLENHPAIVDRIAAGRPLLGNPAEVLRRVRDPFAVRQLLVRDGLPSPECMPLSDEPPTSGAWLLKRSNSAGGAGVTVWNEAARFRADKTAWRTHGYFQRYIAGTPHGAVFVAAGGRAVLLGVSEQLIGRRWCGAKAFHYCGSVGPTRLSSEQRDQWRQCGNVLAAGFGLRGVFGVDAIWDGQLVWPVEVNPRYTASVEVLERASGIDALRWHAAACGAGRLLDETVPSALGWCGKAVVFAQHPRMTSAAQTNAWLACRCRRRAAVADVPAAGSKIYPVQPVISVLVEDVSREQVRRRLRELALGISPRFRP